MDTHESLGTLINVGVAVGTSQFNRTLVSFYINSECQSDRLLGIQRNGVARAYPVAILNWHEIVNDVIGGEAVVITYCPLCGTGVAFAARINWLDTHFGVSGLLYNSDVLLYDRETKSLWSQILAAR